MNIIYTTQSTSLQLFWSLNQSLKPAGNIGYFVSNNYQLDKFMSSNPTFESAGLSILKEHDIIASAKALTAVDFEYIEKMEHLLGDATLWNAVISDRRMSYEVRAQFYQSYKASYSHDMLLKILQVSLQKIEAQLDAVRPDAIIGLNAVTLYEYLYYLFAKQRKIPYLQLKLTRIENYISLFSSPFELSPHIVKSYKRFQSLSTGERDKSELYSNARMFLQESVTGTLRYEGAINRPNEKVARQSGLTKIHRKLSGIISHAMDVGRVSDPHYLSTFETILQMKVLKRFRKFSRKVDFDIYDAESFLQKNQSKFALFPLNTEPEVALLSYGRPYRNQIETVRNAAAALPVGWKLLVKEHPNSVGYRKTSYYKKLQEIPNVLLVSPSSDTGALIAGAGLVLLVYGTIGLEAIIKKTPLVVFSGVPYDILPSHMVKFSQKPWQLGHDIKQLISTYEYDEHAVLSYVAAHMETGIRANLFTQLLGKSGRKTQEIEKTITQQYDEIAAYLESRVAEEKTRLQADIALG